MPLPGWIDRHRFLFVAAVTGWAALPLALFKPLAGHGPHAPDVAHLLRETVLGAGVLAVLAGTWGYRRTWAYTPRREWRDLRVLWPVGALVGLIVVAGLSGGLDPDRVKVAIQVPTFAITGFLEETEFRGLIFGVLLVAWAGRGRAGQLAAIAGSSALFAAIHLTNAATLSPGLVANQVSYTFVFAVGLAAMRLRANTIWPLIAIHATMDILGALTPNTPTDHLTVGVVLAGQLPSLLVAAYGLVLLRRMPAETSAAAA
ncbi:MAG TPA: CPBP family intramembrane glutamic endopeptidase [Rugosimonospora sp.]|nr:CPBP family intramembrane glutamic endopeptidase [Rugosimonospora sp.]